MESPSEIGRLGNYAKGNSLIRRVRHDLQFADNVIAKVSVCICVYYANILLEELFIQAAM